MYGSEKSLENSTGEYYWLSMTFGSFFVSLPSPVNRVIIIFIGS